METMFGTPLGAATAVLLVTALGLALAFEFVNGFHDTANAVATVIYTHTLTPTQAVVWSGAWNFLGVLVSNGAVAFGIVALLPVELILHVGSAAGFAMIFAILLSAIIWNLGTWYLGLPASSSHTLIGSIVGVGLTNSLLAGSANFGEGVNWGKVEDAILALVVSPLLGFFGAAALFLAARTTLKNPVLYMAPEGKAPPPPWIRALLMLTCTGVSFAHGSNDGQKGMGLIMLILIGVLPAVYALNLAIPQPQVAVLLAASQAASPFLEKVPRAGPLDNMSAEIDLSEFLTSGMPNPQTLPSLALKNANITAVLGRTASLQDLSTGERNRLRRDVYLTAQSIGKLLKSKVEIEPADRAVLSDLGNQLTALTNFIPAWVKVAVALALGLGTMIGWKRIVVTIGEKIGRSRLTYAQGASAEVIAMTEIAMADLVGLPVSTTHILASGIAGTMFANHSGLQKETLRNILLAWVLTLPACVILGSVLFSGCLFVALRLF